MPAESDRLPAQPGRPPVRGGALGVAEARLRQQDALAAIERLPSLPTVVMAVLKETRSPTSRIADIEGHLRQDLVLSAKCLKMANSPFFALPNPVSNIQQAVSVLGFNSLKSLVMASATSNLFTVDLSAYGYTPAGLWPNSLAVAVFARRLAQLRNASNDEAENLFVGGLLRDLGMVVLAPFLAKAGVRLGAHEDDLVAREHEAIGLTHVWVGQQLAQRWHLPPELAAILAGHHQDIDGPGGELGLHTVMLAERIAAHHGIGLTPDHPFDAAIEAPLVAAAGLDLARFKTFLGELPELRERARMELP